MALRDSEEIARTALRMLAISSLSRRAI